MTKQDENQVDETVEENTEAAPNLNAIVVFNPSAVATFGNNFLKALVFHELSLEAAQRELADGAKREDFIDVELTRAAMALHDAEKIDLLKIYGTNSDSTSLYRAILVEIGVYVREIKDDKVLYSFTDKELAQQYEYDDKLKKDNEAEYKRRHARRNSLNIRLARCCKAALALIEAGATIDHVTYKENNQGERQPVITKGPAEIMGLSKEVVIHSKNAAAVEGATRKPTLGGLAKIADEKHKKVDEPASKGETETTTRKEGENGTNEEDFLAMSNAFLMAMRTREGKFSDSEIAALKNVLTEVSQYVKK